MTIRKCQDESYLFYLTFSPDGKTLAAIENRSGIHLWDTASGKNMASFNWDDERLVDPLGVPLIGPVLDKLLVNRKSYFAHVHWHSVFFNPDGRLVALGARGGGTSGPRHTVEFLEVATIRTPKQ